MDRVAFVLAVYYTALLYLALIVLFALLVIAMVIGYELLRRDFRRLHKADRSAETVDRARQIQDQIDALKGQIESASLSSQKELDRLWQKTDQSLTDRLDQAGQTVSQVHQSLGAIRDASQRIVELGGQLADLGDALRLPPGGGAAGDGQVWLADLLGQMLPPQHYQLNAILGDARAGGTGDLGATGGLSASAAGAEDGPAHVGTGAGDGPAHGRVDAAVRLGNQLIVIDAGFPVTGSAGGPGSGGSAGSRDIGDLERLARQHVDRIAAACIRPDRGTVDFALMYLPAEGLYYDLVIRPSHHLDSLSNYALSRRVIPVSPNTLYAYLYTIVLGLRGLQVEQEAEKIVARLGQVRQQFQRLQESFQTLGSQLDHATNRYDFAQRQMDRFGETLNDVLAGESADPPRITARLGMLKTPTPDKPAEPSPPPLPGPLPVAADSPLARPPTDAAPPIAPHPNGMAALAPSPAGQPGVLAGASPQGLGEPAASFLIPPPAPAVGPPYPRQKRRR